MVIIENPQATAWGFSYQINFLIIYPVPVF